MNRRRQAVHVLLLVIVVPCAVLVDAAWLPPLAFWVSGVTEAVLGSASAGAACKEVGKTTGRWLLGLVGVFVLGVLSVV